MELNLVKIIDSIKDVATTILDKDITTVRGFSERQIEAIAKQTVIIKKGILNGDIDEDLKEFFFDGLEAMALNFVNTLKNVECYYRATFTHYSFCNLIITHKAQI
jgi:hypothetical protein